jgi:hypothetical protein
MLDEHAGELHGGVERRKVTRELVVIVKAAEGLVDDAGTLLAVRGLDRANLDRRTRCGSSRFGRACSRVGRLAIVLFRRSEGQTAIGDLQTLGHARRVGGRNRAATTLAKPF